MSNYHPKKSPYWNTDFLVQSATCLIFLILVPLRQLDFLKLMPGDFGDARFNNFILENFYIHSQGSWSKIWNPQFFYPFKYVIGFSENHFGTAWIYSLLRTFGLQSDTSFQLWFVFGYIANYFSAIFSLRKLGIKTIGTTVGSLIFAFAIPVTANAGWAHLHYRFGIPLAIMYWVKSLEEKNFKYAVAATFWLVWQFYSGIYMGVFTLIALTAILLSNSITTRISRRKNREHKVSHPSLRMLLSSKKIVTYLIIEAFLLAMLILLFFPYLRVVQIYDFERLWEDVSSMLPRAQSYLISDSSLLWYKLSYKITDIPMRQEHQLFVGIVPASLTIIGLFVALRHTPNKSSKMFAGTILLSIIATISVSGLSLWYLFYHLPLFSSIRAVTRINLMLLFPIAYFSSIAIDGTFKKRTHIKTLFLRVTGVLCIALLLFETSETAMYTTQKVEWRARIENAESMLPENLPRDSILFFSQNSDPYYFTELDAMWVSLRNNYATFNGYSGNFPPGYNLGFGSDCNEMTNRITAFTSFASGTKDEILFLQLKRRAIQIGFEGC
jgi:uncharacterized membrane protein